MMTGTQWLSNLVLNDKAIRDLQTANTPAGFNMQNKIACFCDYQKKKPRMYKKENGGKKKEQGEKPNSL